MRFSLNLKLGLFWIFTIIISMALAWILNGFYEHSARTLIQQSTQTAQSACQEIQKKFSWAIDNRSFEPAKESQFIGALLEIVLDRYSSVEGGAWNSEKGFFAYAYPTYEGSGIKRDVPSAEMPFISKIAAQTLAKSESTTESRRGSREAMILTTCPLTRSSAPTAIWTMTRVSLSSENTNDHFAIGVGLLLFFVVISGAGLSFMLLRWSRSLTHLESQISHYSVDDFPVIPDVHEPELNRVIAALNQLSTRLSASRAESAGMAKRLAQADRLSALGKMSAGIAHEIRNPLATMRLKLENAAAFPNERMEKAIPVLFEQIQRMDRLVQMMLAMTQPFSLKAETVDLESWFASNFEDVRTKAAANQVAMRFSTTVATWSFDAFHFSRAVQNLLQNAVSFSNTGSSVSVTARQEQQNLIITISDVGPGISKLVSQSLFEPFATGRADGTGLGLNLAREIVEAHGGVIRHVPTPSGTTFQMEIPWLRS